MEDFPPTHKTVKSQKGGNGPFAQHIATYFQQRTAVMESVRTSNLLVHHQGDHGDKYGQAAHGGQGTTHHSHGGAWALKTEERPD